MKLLAIAGSLRENSYNRQLARSGRALMRGTRRSDTAFSAGKTCRS